MCCMCRPFLKEGLLEHRADMIPKLPSRMAPCEKFGAFEVVARQSKMQGFPAKDPFTWGKQPASAALDPAPLVRLLSTMRT